MNIGTIAGMISKDATILNDIPAFINYVNNKNIPQVRNVQTVVSREEYFTSIAEQNGGDATAEDVVAAQTLLNTQPLLEDASARYLKVVGAITSGEAFTAQDVINKFAE
jgi:hypothetical protein